MFGYIYISTNLINGKQYIGQHAYNGDSIDPKYLGSGNLFIKALKKYGENNFSCEIIEWCNSYEKLNEREKYWISYYNAVESENFYNLDRGGRNSSPTEETREKIRNTIKATHHLWPHYGGRGKKKSQEQCERIRIMNRGRPGYWKGKKLYPETVEKIKLKRIGQPSTKKGIPISDEERQRLYEWYLKNVENGIFTFKGHKHSEESKKIIGEKSTLAVTGRIYIVKDNVEKRIKAEELDLYLSNGWKKGRLEERKLFQIAGTKAATGIKKIYKDGINKNVPKEEVDKWLAEGWRLGCIEKKQSWSEERKKENSKRISEITKGTKCINNGKENKLVKLEKLDDYLKNGWVLGRLNVGKLKNYQTINKGKICINNGKINKYIFPEELEEYLNNGWKKGGKVIKNAL